MLKRGNKGCSDTNTYAIVLRLSNIEGKQNLFVESIIQFDLMMHY